MFVHLLRGSFIHSSVLFFLYSCCLQYKAKVAELLEKFSKSTKKMTAPMSIKSSPKDEDYDIQMWCASFNDVLFLFMGTVA